MYTCGQVLPGESWFAHVMVVEPCGKGKDQGGVLARCEQFESRPSLQGSPLIVIRVSLLFAALLFAASPARSQISPGPLSKAHESLSGTTQCASCHQFGTSTPTFKCLECHKEIAGRLAAKHGYHYQIQMRNPNGKDCVRCHLEHNGENFNLLHWEPSQKQFDHRLTGYNLEGKHAQTACEKCHSNVHGWPRTFPHQDEGPLKIFLRPVAGLRPMSQRSPQRTARQQLLAMPQFHGLESRQTIRSFEDPLSPDRSAHAGGLRKVPQTRSARRSRALQRHEVFCLHRLPRRSPQGVVQAALRGLPHNRRLEKTPA